MIHELKIIYLSSFCSFPKENIKILKEFSKFLLQVLTVKMEENLHIE